jgi:hypothetical protein
MSEIPIKGAGPRSNPPTASSQPRSASQAAWALFATEPEEVCEVAEWKKQIGAINLIVGDLERSKAFYRDVFGLPLQHEDQETAMFRFADTYVFLQRGAAHQNRPSDDALRPRAEGRRAIRHLC